MIDGCRILNSTGRFWSAGMGWGCFSDSTQFTRSMAQDLVLPVGAVIRMDCDLVNAFIHTGELEVTRPGLLTQDWVSMDGRLVAYTEIINHGSRHNWYKLYHVSIDGVEVYATRSYSQALRVTLLHLYGEDVL